MAGIALVVCVKGKSMENLLFVTILEIVELDSRHLEEVYHINVVGTHKNKPKTAMF